MQHQEAGDARVVGGVLARWVDVDDDDRVRLRQCATELVPENENAPDCTARQEAVINNPGSAFAPAIKTLVSNPLTPVTNAAVSAGIT